MGWLVAIIVGGIAGWIAEKIMKADHGLLTNIILGILGAVILNAILSAVGIYTAESWLAWFIVAIIGACALIWGYRMVKGRT